MKLTIDENHTYRFNDKIVPGVSEVLDAAAIKDSTYFNEYYAQRGSDIHLICQLFDEDDLDIDSIDESYLPYLECYESFINDYNPQWSHIEHMVYNERYAYAGTIDRVGFLEENRHVCIDIKSGQSQPWHAIQLAAYVNAFVSDPKDIDIYGLYLKPQNKKKKYQLKKYPKGTSWAVFKSALNIYYWKNKKD